MLKITEISIRNFRSIVNQTISVADMNIFVGLNDVGKSNVLKALNLFFNGETDINNDFDFIADYSKLAPVRINKAKEIVVSLKIEVPDHYADGGIILWKKVWRDGYSGVTPFINEMHPFDRPYTKEQPFMQRSKTPTALRRIKYYYIPAVKSTDYFKYLLGSLYASASATVDSTLLKQSQDYSEALKLFTLRISEIVKEKIGIDSVLTMPENQIDIFRELAFGTKDSHKNDISLDFRGDGVKARHIPAILKFIEEQDKKAGINSVPYSVIWGYEEPENGVEMLKCYELADEFYSYASELQSFITTHSPAFYSQANNSNVEVFTVSQDDEGTTQIDTNMSLTQIDETIGILPLVTPYINEQVKKVKEYEQLLEENYLTDIDTIIVEGKTDKYYIENAIENLSSKLQKRIESGKLRILTKDNSCGVKQLHDWMLAWCLAGFESCLVAVFDADSAGEDWISKLRKNPIYENNTSKPSIVKLEPSQGIIEVMRENIDIPYYIEHLLPLDIWVIALEKGLLADRDITEQHKIVLKCMQLNTTIKSAIDNAKIEERIKECWITKTIDDGANTKSSFMNIVKESQLPKGKIYEGFSRTISKLENKFK